MPYPFAMPQAIRFALGLALMICVALLPPRILVMAAAPVYALSLVLLAAVLHMGHVGKGRNAG